MMYNAIKTLQLLCSISQVFVTVNNVIQNIETLADNVIVKHWLSNQVNDVQKSQVKVTTNTLVF